MRKWFVAIGLAVLVIGFSLSYWPREPGGSKPSYYFTIWGMYGEWEDTLVKAGMWWAMDHGIDFACTNALMNDAKQVQDIYYLAELADGIIVGPVSLSAPVTAVERTAAQGIPVVSVNSEVQTDALAMSICFGNERAARAIAEKIVDYLRENVDPIGVVEGTVLNLQGDLSMSNGIERNDGFMEVMENYPGVEVISGRAYFKATPAEEITHEKFIAEEGKIDAIFAANAPMVLGAQRAIESMGVEPGEVFMGCIDGSPTVIRLMRKGWVQVAFEQPTQFYLPIAMHYLNVIRENGIDALPDYGSTVTTDDLKISGEAHLGNLDIWIEQTWAPAVIEERYGHRWFMTNGKLLTLANYDDPFNWGVMFENPWA